MSQQISNIHDSFFKQVLSEPELAGTFLREHLPAEVASLLGSEAPEQIPGSFVDEQLRQHHTDLIFRLRLNVDRDAFAYILVEHKSSPDTAARLQLLRYVVRLLTSWYDQNKQRLPLPAVLPLVVHQGPGGWAASREFVDLFGDVPAPLRHYLPSFRHALVYLGPMENRDLSDEVRLQAFLKALKYCQRPDLPACMDIVLAEAPLLENRDLWLILKYLSKGPVKIDDTVIHETLQRLVPDRKEQIVGFFRQPFYEEGRAAGREEGRTEGGANLLIRLLEKRFGALPVTRRQSILAADVQSIDAWAERVLDAPDLQSIFDPELV